jgi:hypothetical protein
MRRFAGAKIGELIKSAIFLCEKIVTELILKMKQRENSILQNIFNQRKTI